MRSSYILINVTLIVALMLLFLSGCTDDPGKVSDKPLVDTEWDLQSFEIVGGGESDIGSEGIILVFGENDSVKGWTYSLEGYPSTPGNSYGGVYEAGLDGSLSIQGFYTTYVGLLPGSKYEEYMIAIKNASAYEIQGNTLKILYDGGTKALNFKGE